MLGITCDGHKEVFSLSIDENGSAKFWLNALNELKNRVVEKWASKYPNSIMKRWIENWDVVVPIFKFSKGCQKNNILNKCY